MLSSVINQDSSNISQVEPSPGVGTVPYSRSLRTSPRGRGKPGPSRNNTSRCAFLQQGVQRVTTDTNKTASFLFFCFLNSGSDSVAVAAPCWARCDTGQSFHFRIFPLGGATVNHLFPSTLPSTLLSRQLTSCPFFTTSMNSFSLLLPFSCFNFYHYYDRLLLLLSLFFVLLLST